MQKPAANKVDLSDGIDLSDIAGLLVGASVTNTQANPAAGLIGSLLGGSSQQTQQAPAVSNLLGSLLGGNNSAQKADGTELLGLLAQFMNK